MQKSITLRKFTPSDLQKVMKINRICLPENYTDIFFMDLYRRFPETYIVAEDEGEINGYIMCRIEVGLSNFGLSGLIRKGHVVSIAVLPNGRRKGIAQGLMEMAMKGMLHYKAKQCYLEVRSTNHAGIGLYKKLGFEISRTSHGYYSDGEDAYIMTKNLKK
jgi:ribosomal-protein-alanine N-acetyltransferase